MRDGRRLHKAGIASALQDFCVSQNHRFCFIGGLAVQRWGDPRDFLGSTLLQLKEAPEIEDRLRQMMEKEKFGN